MNEKILIVEDDLESLKLIGLMLQRRGYKIVAANAGDQALKKAEDEEPDLIILDVMMPGINGYEVCRQLRSNPQTSHLPVIMFTAKALVEDKTAGFAAGADDSLTKPIHPTELVSHVEGLLQRPGQAKRAGRHQSRARVIGIMGAKGGVGTSTLAVNLAVAANQLSARTLEQPHEPQVSLVELRASQGSTALMLGQMPDGRWAGLLGHDIDDLNGEIVERYLATHETGLRFLPALFQPETTMFGLEPGYVEVVLDHLCAATDDLFLDLGSALDPATEQALAFCDTLVIVTEPERICLTLAQVLLDEVRARSIGPADVRIVLVERSLAGTAYSYVKIEEFLRCKLVGVIQPADEVLRQAAERGQPVVLSYPESEIAAQYLKLSQDLHV
jgi:DNA-binding response OmpR family regulator